MNTRELSGALATLFGELVDGAAASGSYMLNRGDVGLLRSLDQLSAAQASERASGGATIAAHADHLAFGLALMNRWAGGEADPWTGADWTASWRTTSVTEDEWRSLRERLGDESRRWLAAMREPREVSEVELDSVIGSIAHLAYHLGAIRQIERAARGPTAEEERAEKDRAGRASR